MYQPAPRFGYRIVLLLLCSLVGVHEISDSAQAGSIGGMLKSGAWLALGALCLVAPMPLGSAKAALRQSRDGAERHRVLLRNALIWLAGGLFVVGLSLRFLGR